MSRKRKIESILSEELERFNQIGGYVENLHEQFLGFAGAKTELGEQEEEGEDLNIELDDEGTTEPTDDTATTEGGDDLDLGGDEENLGDDLGGEGEITDDTTDTTGNTEEIDVTDIVTMTKETGEKAEELEGTIGKQKDSIDSLIAKLDDLEGKLNSMDKVMSSINDLEDKIEEYRPQTPEEKLELRYLDSGPFNQSPKKYWEEKKGELKKQKDKHEYVLTADDVENVNDNDIKNSWVYSPEDE